MDQVTACQSAWRESVDRTLTLCLRLHRDDWDRPTDLPGWTVRDVLAHLAHVEAELVDGRSRSADGGPGVHGGAENVRPEWTEHGVEARRDRSPDALRAELAAAVLQRASLLGQLSPVDPGARPEVTPAGLDWDWATLLRNRAVDVWVHEQDIRRAVDRPGGMSGMAAEVVVDTFVTALPYVLGKRVAPAPGTAVRWRVQGPVEVDRTVRVDGSGRAAFVGQEGDAAVEQATVLTMGTETFVLLAAGRRTWDQVRDDVQVDGDGDLARRVGDAMGVTP